MEGLFFIDVSSTSVERHASFIDTSQKSNINPAYLTAYATEKQQIPGSNTVSPSFNFKDFNKR